MQTTIQKQRCAGPCKQEKPLTEFHRDRRKKSGRVARCKVCTSEWQKANYTEERREANRRWREANPERIRQYRIAEALSFPSEKRRKKHCKAARRYYKKNKNNPEFQERRRQYNRNRYRELVLKQPPPAPSVLARQLQSRIF